MAWTPSNSGGAGTTSWTITLTTNGWTYTVPPSPNVGYTFSYTKGNGVDSANVTIYGMYRTGPNTFNSVNIQNYTTAGNTPNYSHSATIPATSSGYPLDHIRVTNAGIAAGSSVTNPQRLFYPTGHPSNPPPPVTPTTNLPALLAAVAANANVPLGTYTGPTDDLARDVGDQAGKVIRDDGYGTYVAEPWPTATGTPVLVVSTGVNLIATDSGLDIDTSGFAQQVRVVYEWETPNPDYASGKKVKFEDGTVGDPYRTIAHLVEATSSPSHGPITLTVERDRIPVTQAQAQAVADALGARAWLRGQTLTVVCSLALWVRLLDTVRVDLPYGPARDLLVSSARHDYARKTSTLVLRPASLSVWPLEA